MTCRALTYVEMAEVFVERGALVYIGWSDLVEADHNDRAITVLVQELVGEEVTIKQAVVQAMDQVGLDPEYDSQLGWFPAENGDYVVSRSD